MPMGGYDGNMPSGMGNMGMGLGGGDIMGMLGGAGGGDMMAMIGPLMRMANFSGGGYGRRRHRR